MVASTYKEAMAHVLDYEGSYTNDPEDSGGPTNWGITIHDARAYWKKNATAADVKRMPLSVALDIYAKRYAAPLRYDDLPAGVDFAILDYGINSGISRAAKVLQRLVGVKVDGIIGLVTLAAVSHTNADDLIDAICNERMRFLRSLRIFRTFGKGWTRRVADVRKTAHHMTE